MLGCAKKNIGWFLMVIQNHALPDSDQNGNSCYRSLIHRYFIGSQNAVFSIHCSYFLNKKVIVIAAEEKEGHHKKVILSSKLKNYAPVFLPFFGNIFLFSSYFFWWKNPFFLFFWRTYVLGTLQLYIFDLRFKAWGPTTFLTQFQILSSSSI